MCVMDDVLTGLSPPPLRSSDMRVVCRDSNGCVSVLSLTAPGLETTAQWKALRPGSQPSPSRTPSCSTQQAERLGPQDGALLSHFHQQEVINGDKGVQVMGYRTLPDGEKEFLDPSDNEHVIPQAIEEVVCKRRHYLDGGDKLSSPEEKGKGKRKKLKNGRYSDDDDDDDDDDNDDLVTLVVLM
ncbi:unnamed protein product [Gadus morhua 'NCC']